MNSGMEHQGASQLNERLATSGLRFTTQRQHVYDTLLSHRDHPTAEEVFLRVKHTIPEISLATVYNCLDALVKCSLVRQVNLDRAATRYCPNMNDHFHFYCDDCGRVFDIASRQEASRSQVRLPDGFVLTHCEVSLRGKCKGCAAKR